jgi:hypothetical protein
MRLALGNKPIINMLVNKKDDENIKILSRKI